MFCDSFFSSLSNALLCFLSTVIGLFCNSVAISAPTTLRIRGVDFYTGKTVCELVCLLVLIYSRDFQPFLQRGRFRGGPTLSLSTRHHTDRYDTRSPVRLCYMLVHKSLNFGSCMIRLFVRPTFYRRHINKTRKPHFILSSFHCGRLRTESPHTDFMNCWMLKGGDGRKHYVVVWGTTGRNEEKCSTDRCTNYKVISAKMIFLFSFFICSLAPC